MLAVAWLLVFAGIYWYFDGWYQQQYNPNPQSVLKNHVNEVVLKRNRAGHYVADGEINGQPVVFLLDTGATQVALSTGLANHLGLEAGQRVQVQTANGIALGYQSTLASVRLGPIEVHDVSALVTNGMEGNAVLLGMSFLKQLEFTQHGDTLILRRLAIPNT
jgi:aspartyl protease family protein